MKKQANNKLSESAETPEIKADDRLRQNVLNKSHRTIKRLPSCSSVPMSAGKPYNEDEDEMYIRQLIESNGKNNYNQYNTNSKHFLSAQQLKKQGGNFLKTYGDKDVMDGSGPF